VSLIVVQFDDSQRQRVRGSKLHQLVLSKENLLLKEKYDGLSAHYHGIVLPTQPILIELGYDNKTIKKLLTKFVVALRIAILEKLRS
jgi:hypothetical protein